VGETWLSEPEEHDFPAAANYLSLLAQSHTVENVVAALRTASTIHFKAKDLLRASRLPLLARDNEHVHHDLKKIEAGTSLSPVLLVRGDATNDLPLTIADGYHRICASYWIDENTDIPCRVVSWPT
jgi:hypothetical protein